MPCDERSPSKSDRLAFPRRCASTTTEVLDGEAVVYSSESKALHVINPTGTVIWQSLDGHVSVDTLAAEMSDVFGAPYDVVHADVLRAVRSFSEMGLLEGMPLSHASVTGPPSASPRPEPEHGFAPIASFGCDSRTIERLAWAPTRAYRIGPHLMGIRANTGDIDELLRAALADHVVEDVKPPYANYSIRIERPAERTVSQQLHLLYEGGCLIARSRHALDVIGALLHHLGARAPQPVPGPRVWCTPLRRRDGSAVLASVVIRRQAARHSSRLRSRGLELLHAPAVRFDPGTSEAVVPTPALTVANDALHTLSVLSGDRGASVSHLFAEQRLPLRSWVFMSAAGAFEKLNRSDALPLAVRALVDEEEPTPATLRVLAQVLTVATPIAAGDLHSPQVVARLPTST